MRAGNFTFDDMSRNNGELFMLDVLVLFTNMKGECGVEYAVQNVRSGQTIFCVWDPHQEPIMKHGMVGREVPRRYDVVLPNGNRFNEQFDNSEQGSQFMDTDLALQIRSRFNDVDL